MLHLSNLTAEKGLERPCVFGDILDRMLPEHRRKLDELLAEARATTTARVRNGEIRKDVIKDVGRRLLAQAPLSKLAVYVSQVLVLIFGSSFSTIRLLN